MCRENGLALPDLPEEIIAEMDKHLPPFWSRGNPIDLVGLVNPVVYNHGAGNGHQKQRLRRR